MTTQWASLQEAAETVRAAGVENPTEAITRAVSAAMIVRPGTVPLPDRTPPAPRLRVITQRTTVGMDWLQAPALDFEKSEILCRSYMAGTQEEFSHPRDLHPARIELWNDDLLRLWPAGGIQHSQAALAAAAVSPPGFLTNKQEALQAECVAWLQICRRRQRCPRRQPSKPQRKPLKDCQAASLTALGIKPHPPRGNGQDERQRRPKSNHLHDSG
jgi:hypothetical protein